MLSDEFLAHHGIKGQKWGVQNGPPYPLDKQNAVDVANNIYNTLDKFDYGCIIDGRKFNENNLDEVDWSKYRTTPVKDLDKTKIGVCWDFTNYQHNRLKEAGIDHKTHMLVMDTDDGVVTHTFTTFKDPKSNQEYWLEQALYSERGIHPIKSYKDVVDKVSNRYDPSKKRPYDVYEFNPDGMDQGLTDQEFFNRATRNDPIYQRSSIEHSELAHHGIKGQKWGVRRFQNPDGTLTKAGKQHVLEQRNVSRNKPYTDDVNDIVRTLSKQEKEFLGAPTKGDWIDKNHEHATLKEKAATFVTKHGDTPISFVEIWTNGGKTGQIALATRNDPNYRGKGYASKNVEDAIKWCDRYGSKSIKELEWIADRNNKASINLGKKHGFTEDDPNKHGHNWKDDWSKEYAIMYRPVKQRR